MTTVGLVFENTKKPKDNNEELTINQIKEILTANNIAFDEKAKKADLMALLPQKG